MYRFLILSLLLARCGSQTEKTFNCTMNGTQCPEKESVINNTEVINPTIAGPRGPAGERGQAGTNGSSCSAERVSNGVTISCTDGTIAVLLDGQAGADGADGEDAPPTAYSVTEVLDPCGDQTGFDEVLLHTANGKWIAHFASGSLQFLTILSPGTYVTTDQSQCYFTLTNAGTIVNEHN